MKFISDIINDLLKSIYLILIKLNNIFKIEYIHKSYMKPPFIHKNNKELCKSLNKLGYIGFYILPEDAGLYLMYLPKGYDHLKEDTYYYFPMDKDDFNDSVFKEKWIDCGTDEDLFLQYAKLYISNK